MMTLVNTNLVRPPIAPIGIEYVASALLAAGEEEVEVLDLCLAGRGAIREYFSRKEPELVGLSFRNVDDSFWPSARSFVPELAGIVAEVRHHSAAPLVLGGVGYSIFPGEIIERTGADYGIVGDGEIALAVLLRAIRNAGGGRPDAAELAGVPGLVWRDKDGIRRNAAAWGCVPGGAFRRDIVDNATYLRLGGQIGLETKRGCPRRCIFCVDWRAKGAQVRLREPSDVAEETGQLLRGGIDVLHLCDCEFNIHLEHALAVCEEFTRRRIGEKIRWYAYLAVTPFPRELAVAMREAGCVGINFTGPTASAAMLRAYRQLHEPNDIGSVVRLCRENSIAVMIDLMLGGPGETPETIHETVNFLRECGPDCVGAGLGYRLGPGLPMTELVAREAPLDANPGVRRHYEGPIDLLQPTYYISPALGTYPASIVREAIAGDPRFFPPSDEILESTGGGKDEGYNYSDNTPLVKAIAAGARGAYWDILRKMNKRVT